MGLYATDETDNDNDEIGLEDDDDFWGEDEFLDDEDDLDESVLDDLEDEDDN
jgi:hypothetical protein